MFIISGQCTVNGNINYTVELMDNTGEIVEQMNVTSDSCNNGICSTSVSPETCIVRVQATSLFGNSGKAFINVGKLRNFVFVVDLACMSFFLLCYYFNLE